MKKIITNDLPIEQIYIDLVSENDFIIIVQDKKIIGCILYQTKSVYSDNGGCWSVVMENCCRVEGSNLMECIDYVRGLIPGCEFYVKNEI